LTDPAPAGEHMSPNKELDLTAMRFARMMRMAAGQFQCWADKSRVRQC
jgi:hypothetical protein